MYGKFIPKISISESIMDSKLNTNTGLSPMRMDAIGAENKTPSFGDVMTGMVKNLNETTKAPDQVMQSAVMGNGADVHDVMIAISKAEVGVNIATQITTKVVQAYEKIMAIQV
ncbi:MAG: flagellar hook-basal body complex protein FliE [Candidatus Gastranaerophilaceae bacterium]|jgi:flagellar hook-basal body complex protein FliE